eukprot:CAMPEP_0182911438 /NCGR_PEP_ID=MMETSP0034_2-20130328/36925_1 /TAXON_ID=156128 /ORGANISM="Nephroselmis pyriformis, Strain CCMP717" /LENGTH=111 /DNA_ID=CAMNT_0025047961 /DNA_START=25 /DNA_END=358 /DNA_ORIENTATION=+
MNYPVQKTDAEWKKELSDTEEHPSSMHAAPPLSRGLPSRAGLTSRAGPPSRTPEVLRCPPGRRRHTSRLPVGGPLTHPPVRRRYKVLRGKGTEPARSGEYDKFYPKTGYFV